MTTVQPQNTLPANTAQLTYRFLAAVCLIVFLLWLAGLVFLEPDPYALYIFTGIILAVVTLAAGSSARGPKAATMKSSEKVEFLKSLPESFQIFTNVSIGVRTNLDAVIVGTNGVFIVDVKTRSGKIEPTAGSDWIRHKVGSKGTPYRVPMKNPLQHPRTAVVSRLLRRSPVDRRQRLLHACRIRRTDRGLLHVGRCGARSYQELSRRASAVR